MAELDLVRLRELAELGYWAASTDGADFDRHRKLNKNADYWLARGHRFDHLRREHELRRQRQNPALSHHEKSGALGRRETDDCVPDVSHTPRR
jgi:hypothetical protein